MKTQINITLDTDVLEKARQLQLNISGECSNFLRNRVNSARKDLNSFDIQLLQIKKEKLSKKFSESQAELLEVDNQISQIELKVKEEEERKLQLEREAIEKEKTCLFCHTALVESRIKIISPGKVVCKNCWNTDSRKILKIINEETKQ
jgi:protein-arginine kinase activator protein McsA